MDYWRCLLLPVHPTDAKRVVDHLIGSRNLSSISGRSIRNNTTNKRAYTWLFYCCKSFKCICNYWYMVQKDKSFTFWYRPYLSSKNFPISVVVLHTFGNASLALKGFPCCWIREDSIWWNRLVNTTTEDIIDIRSSRVTDYGRSFKCW